MFRNNFVPVKIVAIFVMFYEPCVNLLLLFRKVSCRGYQRKKRRKKSAAAVFLFWRLASTEQIGISFQLARF